MKLLAEPLNAKEISYDGWDGDGSEIKQYGLELQALGWSQAALDKVFLAEMASRYESPSPGYLFEEALIWQSALFQKLWPFECRAVQPQQAENLLELAMLYMDMPDELSGEAADHPLALTYASELIAIAFFGISFLKRFGRFFPSSRLLLQTVAIALKAVAPVSLRHFQSAY